MSVVARQRVGGASLDVRSQDLDPRPKGWRAIIFGAATEEDRRTEVLGVTSKFIEQTSFSKPRIPKYEIDLRGSPRGSGERRRKDIHLDVTADERNIEGS